VLGALVAIGLGIVIGLLIDVVLGLLRRRRERRWPVREAEQPELEKLCT
jgi:NhaP-type Na+/H+ or K+/H+ antiporter